MIPLSKSPPPLRAVGPEHHAEDHTSNEPWALKERVKDISWAAGTKIFDGKAEISSPVTLRRMRHLEIFRFTVE